MEEKRISRNLTKFRHYNRERQQMFFESSPKEAQQILYLLPWMLSLNHPKIPGYIQDLEFSFRVYGIERDPEIRKREARFRTLFGIGKDARLFLRNSVGPCIDGLYSIGSVGTLGQTSDSDCDVWICCDSKRVGQDGWEALQRKLNIIKDWLDVHCRMPIFFFLSDIGAIRLGDFGRTEDESSGSAQKNVLKEEFYRTSIVLMGKVPFWWVCWDPERPMDYQATWEKLLELKDISDELVDLGNLEEISEQEFFGAALWQLHKSLTSPLKSVIKMTLLRMYLDRVGEALPCHRFQDEVLKDGACFQDPMTFSMSLILQEYGKALAMEDRQFLARCFYLRCGLTAFEQNRPIRKEQAVAFVRMAGLSLEEQCELGGFGSWDSARQMRLGKAMMLRLFRFYDDIVQCASDAASLMDRRDLTVLGRRITAIYKKKDHKVVHLPRPGYELNLQFLEFVWLETGRWSLFAGSDRSLPMLAGVDILEAVAFGVWNGLAVRTHMRMAPNSSSVTLQEIITLSEKIKDLFGRCDVTERDADVFLKAERFSKMLVVISFEKSPYAKDINDLTVIYGNSWGELYVHRFYSPFTLNTFMRKHKLRNSSLEIHYYLQRNSSYYERIIERTKRFTALSLRS